MRQRRDAFAQVLRNAAALNGRPLPADISLKPPDHGNQGASRDISAEAGGLARSAAERARLRPATYAQPQPPQRPHQQRRESQPSSLHTLQPHQRQASAHEAHHQRHSGGRLPPPGGRWQLLSTGWTNFRSASVQMGHLFTPPLRRTTLALLLAWTGLCGGWYAVVLWLPEYFKQRGAQESSLYAQSFAISLANLPGQIPYLCAHIFLFLCFSQPVDVVDYGRERKCNSAVAELCRPAGQPARSESFLLPLTSPLLPCQATGNFFTALNDSRGGQD